MLGGVPWCAAQAIDGADGDVWFLR